MNDSPPPQQDDSAKSDPRSPDRTPSEQNRSDQDTIEQNRAAQDTLDQHAFDRDRPKQSTPTSRQSEQAVHRFDTGGPESTTRSDLYTESQDPETQTGEWTLQEWSEQSVGMGAWELSPETGEIDATPGFRTLLDLPSDEADESATFEEVLSTFHRQNRLVANDLVHRCVETRRPFSATLQRVRADGQTQWIRFSGRPVVDGEGRRVRGIVEDLTRQKQVELEWMELHHALLTEFQRYLGFIVSQCGELTDTGVDVLPDAPRSQLPSVKAIYTHASYLETLLTRSRQLEECFGGDECLRQISILGVTKTIADNFDSAYPNATIEVEGDDVEAFCHPIMYETVVAMLLEHAMENSLEQVDEPPALSITVRAEPGDRIRIVMAQYGPGTFSTPRVPITGDSEFADTPLSNVESRMLHWLVEQLDGTLTVNDFGVNGAVAELSVPTTAEPLQPYLAD